ncbi:MULTISPECIES: RNA polymerase sigma factor [Reichenbachiella]|uniref:RNA polymerase sigma factor n=1 Tax=Reichenbachiella TaxID=156993 RepID=UPI000E6B6787|nr:MULTISPECIES: RNA polymerase sigma factor [Reichenbachiella]MBU2913455.1 RNA polymerase sigma factor [Reichenbachiella agariperforans]RJE74575.1 hypothetical protein BGP76_15640 [Reichenbachiella sp. MSK19-1]
MKNIWLEGCRKNKRKDQEQFYNHYAPKVMGVCRRYCYDRDEAKDVFQEAFINIFKSLTKQKTDIISLDAWVTRVTVNVALDYYKKNKKHYNFLSTDNLCESNLDHQDIIDSLANQDLINLIKKLPEGCQQIFNLFAIEGFSHKEISTKLGISEGTSKSQLSRAKEMLRSQLANLEYNIYEKAAK